MRSLFRRLEHASKSTRVLFCCLVLLALQAGAVAFFPRAAIWSLPVANADGQNAIQIENTYPGDSN